MLKYSFQKVSSANAMGYTCVTPTKTDINYCCLFWGSIFSWCQCRYSRDTIRNLLVWKAVCRYTCIGIRTQNMRFCKATKGHGTLYKALDMPLPLIMYNVTNCLHNKPTTPSHKVPTVYQIFHNLLGFTLTSPNQILCVGVSQLGLSVDKQMALWEAQCSGMAGWGTLSQSALWQ